MTEQKDPREDEEIQKAAKVMRVTFSLLITVAFGLAIGATILKVKHYLYLPQTDVFAVFMYAVVTLLLIGLYGIVMAVLNNE